MKINNDITIMALLANEAEKPARKLLKKYGNNQEASDRSDLEEKLGVAYFNLKISDKQKMKRDIAAIHPHKKFIIKYTKKET